MSSSFQHLHLEDCRGLDGWAWSKRRADHQVSELRVVGCGEDYGSPEPGTGSVSHLSSHWESLKSLGCDSGQPGNLVWCKHITHINSFIAHNSLERWVLLWVPYFTEARDTQDHIASKGQSPEGLKQPGFMLLATLCSCQLFLTYNGWAETLLLDSGHACSGCYSEQDSRSSRKGQMCIFFMVTQRWNIFVFVFLFFRIDFRNTKTKRDCGVTFDWFTLEIQNNSLPRTFWAIWILVQQGTFSNWGDLEVGEGKFLLGHSITKPNLVWSVWLFSETLQYEKWHKNLRMKSQKQYICSLARTLNSGRVSGPNTECMVSSGPFRLNEIWLGIWGVLWLPRGIPVWM